MEICGLIILYSMYNTIEYKNIERIKSSVVLKNQIACS